MGTGVDNNIVGKAKVWGENVVKTDKCMGVSRFGDAPARAVSSKSRPMQVGLNYM